MEILHRDDEIIVCVKPARVLSTDEPGGMPDLVRQELGNPNADVRTVHRLDRVVSGLMVLARTNKSAAELSRQIRDGEFCKEYLAVVHGTVPQESGTLRDLLLRNKAERKTYVVEEPGKDVQEAILNYKLVSAAETLSKVQIELVTGRTHQIRAQFSSRSMPLVGDRKYGGRDEAPAPMLFSCKLTFPHGKSVVEFEKLPEWA